MLDHSFYDGKFMLIVTEASTEEKEKFLNKVSPEPNTGCWLWTGACNARGYGTFSFNNKSWLAHRWGYMIFQGPIPPDVECDHLCRQPACVNPTHIELVSHQVNVARGVTGEYLGAIERAKTHCPKGHLYEESNIYRRPDAPHSRGCRTCRQEANVARGKRLKNKCRSGHIFTKETTAVDFRGRRKCLLCTHSYSPKKVT